MNNNDIGNKLDESVWRLPIPVFCIDIVIFTFHKGKLCVIVHLKESSLGSKYILPGGIMKSGYSLDDTFNFFLKKQTGLDKVFRQQIHVTGELGSDPRGHSVHLSYLSLISEDDLLNNADMTKIKIIDFDEVDDFDIGYSSQYIRIIEHAKIHLIKRMEHTSIAKNLLQPAFTFHNLYQIYENVCLVEIDIRNFKKKMLYIKLIRETGETDKINSKKPAMLYSFN